MYVLSFYFLCQKLLHLHIIVYIAFVPNSPTNCSASPDNFFPGGIGPVLVICDDGITWNQH